MGLDGDVNLFDVGGGWSRANFVSRERTFFSVSFFLLFSLPIAVLLPFFPSSFFVFCFLCSFSFLFVFPFCSFFFPFFFAFFFLIFLPLLLKKKKSAVLIRVESYGPSVCFLLKRPREGADRADLPTTYGRGGRRRKKGKGDRRRSGGHDEGQKLGWGFVDGWFCGILCPSWPPTSTILSRAFSPKCSGFFPNPDVFFLSVSFFSFFRIFPLTPP